MAHDHLFGGFSLSGTGRLGQRGRDDQSAAVFHQRVTHEAELGFLAASLAIKLRLGIRGRGMRGVAALLAVKIALAIAARAGRIARTVLRPETLHRGPGRNLRAVDREVLVRQQPAQLVMIHELGEELRATSASSNRSAMTVGGVTASFLPLSRSTLGWTAGGGFEVALWSNWSAKLEYLHIRANSLSATAPIPNALGVGIASAPAEYRDNIVRG